MTEQKYLAERTLEKELARLGHTLGPRVYGSDIQLAANINALFLPKGLSTEGLSKGEASIIQLIFDSNAGDLDPELTFRRRGLAGNLLLQYNRYHNSRRNEREDIEMHGLTQAERFSLKDLDYASNKGTILGLMTRYENGTCSIWLEHINNPEDGILDQTTPHMRKNLESLQSLDGRIVSPLEYSLTLARLIRSSHNIKTVEER